MKMLNKVSILILALCALSAPAFAQGAGQLNWSGDVDDTVFVYLQRDHVNVVTRHGKNTTNLTVNLIGRLPYRPMHVYLETVSGRGSIRIVRQPTPYDHFTAVIRLHDPQPGRGHYFFSLGWQPVLYGSDPGQF